MFKYQQIKAAVDNYLSKNNLISDESQGGPMPKNPTFGSRQMPPSSATLSGLNKLNANFWGDRAQENWQPGERPIPSGPEAMITSPLQASRMDHPTESIFPEEPEFGSKSSGAEMGLGQNPHSYLEPKDNDSLYRPNMGLANSPHDKSVTLSGYDAPSVMGTFSEPKDSLSSVNAKNKDYWEADVTFTGEPTSISSDYPVEGPRVESKNYGIT